MPHALASIPPGAPILVIDCGSTDRSAEIAQRAGATVVPMRFDGFVRTRLHALEHVPTEWTFMLDADERLDASLRDSIASAQDAGPNGFTISRRTWFCGRPISGCGWGDERILRLFRTRGASLSAHPAGGGSSDLHERWSVAGPAPLLAGRLEHNSYPAIGDYFTRFARYTSIESDGMRPSLRAALVALLKAPLRMVWLFTVRGGWRDGWRGAFIAVFSALYPVVARIKALV